MPDAFLKLPAADRREALAVAAAASGRPLHLLDKDVWLVWLLGVLFQSSFGQHLVFKGGSSLSKGYQIINRFSEDVDLTYDIRMLAPGLSGSGLDPLPATRSQEKRWTKEIRSRLPVWVTGQVMPRISAALTDQALTGKLSAEGEKVFSNTHRWRRVPAMCVQWSCSSSVLAPRASRGNLERSHAMLRRASRALPFHRQRPG